MNEGATAAIFYVSIGALVFGLIRALRASVERHVRDLPGIVVAALGAVGLIVAVIAFLNGPRGMLPF